MIYYKTINQSLFVLLALFLQVFLSYPQELRAQEPPITEETEPDIVVEGKRPAKTESTSHNATTVETENLSGTNLSVADAIEYLPGIHIRRFGGSSSFATIAIRGLGMNYVNVLLNNTPISLTGAGGVDLSLIPVEHIERVEVYRGGGPIQFQSPIGGIIRIKTKIPSKNTQLHSHIGYGSHSTFTTHAGLSGPLFETDVLYFALLSYRDTEGDFPFYNDNNTFYNSLDDFGDRRKNNASNHSYGSLNIQGPVNGEGLWNISLETNWRESGLAGPHPQYGTTPPDSKSTDHGFRLSGELTNIENSASTLRMSSQLFASHANRTFLSNTTLLGLAIRSIQSQSQQAGLQSQLEYQLTPNWKINFAGGLHWDTIKQESSNQTSVGLGTNFDQHRFQYFAGLETPILVSPQLQLTPALRIDWFSQKSDGPTSYDTTYNPKLGLLLWHDNFEFRTNIGYYQRFPNSVEFFGDGLSIAPNPSLQAEKGYLADTNLRAEFTLFGNNLWKLDIGSFLTKITNLIVLLPTSQRYLRAHNLLTQTIAGLEFGLATRYKWGAFNLTYTGLHARNDDGHFTPGIPSHRLNLNISTQWFGLVFSYQPNFQTEIFVDPDNRIGLPQRLLHNINLSYALQKLGLEIKASVHNLADKQSAILPLPGGLSGIVTLGDYLGYPLAGRSFFISCSSKI